MGALLQGGEWPYASSWKGSLAHDRLLFIGRSGGLASYPKGLVDVDIGAKVAGPGAMKAASIHRRAGGGVVDLPQAACIARGGRSGIWTRNGAAMAGATG